MENTKFFEMADRLKTLQEQKKDLEAQTKALGAEITELDLQLSDAMTEAELDRFSRNGSTFYLKSRLFASPAAGRKDEMMQALKENGYGSLVTETVNANTLASFIKEQREITGEEVPTWLGETVSTYEKVSVGKEGTGIYVHIAHRIGTNIDKTDFFSFLAAFLMNSAIVKIAHNIAFESSMAYAKGIVIQAPVYETICASQMSLKSTYEFRKLNESGLKRLASELFGEPLPSFSSLTDGKHFNELDAQDAETVRYGAADSDFALRLYHKFNAWFDRYLPKHRYIVENIESPTAVYLGIMKCNGIPVDLPLICILTTI